MTRHLPLLLLSGPSHLAFVAFPLSTSLLVLQFPYLPYSCHYHSSPFHVISYCPHRSAFLPPLAAVIAVSLLCCLNSAVIAAPLSLLSPLSLRFLYYLTLLSLQCLFLLSPQSLWSLYYLVSAVIAVPLPCSLFCCHCSFSSPLQLLRYPYLIILSSRFLSPLLEHALSLGSVLLSLFPSPSLHPLLAVAPHCCPHTLRH